MRVSRVHLEAVRVAATNLLSAHVGEGAGDGTGEGMGWSAGLWDALQAALAACNSSVGRLREETFGVDEAGDLVRSVVPIRGDPYEHRCTRDSFEAVALAVDGFTGSFTLEDIRAAAELTWTQTAVAFAFLKERSVVVPSAGRKHRISGRAAFEDAMIEYHALREGPSDDQPAKIKEQNSERSPR